MFPTLEARHHVMFNTMIYKLRSPESGEIVLFHFPKDPNRDLVKQVIGVPGDEVGIQGGIVFINGEPLNEPYVTNKASSNLGAVQLSEGGYFVLGDNRPVSIDSRHWGPVPEEDIFGRLGDPFFVP